MTDAPVALNEAAGVILGRGGKVVRALVRGARCDFAVGLLTTADLAGVVIRCRGRDGGQSEGNGSDAHFHNRLAELFTDYRNAKRDVSV